MRIHVSMNLVTQLLICLSNIDEITGRTEIGRLLLGTDLLPSLKIGVTLAFCSIFGYSPDWILKLKKKMGKWFTNDWCGHFKKLAIMPSMLVAFFCLEVFKLTFNKWIAYPWDIEFNIFWNFAFSIAIYYSSVIFINVIWLIVFMLWWNYAQGPCQGCRTCMDPDNFLRGSNQVGSSFRPGWVWQRATTPNPLDLRVPRVESKVPSQFVLKSIRIQVNSYSFWSIRTQKFGQFVLIWSIRTHLVNSYSFGQFVLMSGQFVLILVDSYSFWSIRTRSQMSTNWPKWVRIDRKSVLVMVPQNSYSFW